MSFSTATRLYTQNPEATLPARQFLANLLHVKLVQLIFHFVKFIRDFYECGWQACPLPTTALYPPQFS
ncbi:MAG: hypothetical protein DMG89_26550 [Acidobacteria bacterium]|nr:MAG: hypothetical protein DMG89_26550 [Acidobacteriota bacterium]